MPNPHPIRRRNGGSLPQIALLADIAGSLAMIPAPKAFAQQTGAVSAPGAPPARPNLAGSTQRITVADIVARITRATGVLVLADSTVSGQPVVRDNFLKLAPGDTAAAPDLTAEPSEETLRTVTQQAGQLVKLLPPGTISARLYLPVTGRSKNWTGDDVASFGVSGAQLFGQFGAPVPEGFVEIMGQTVPKDKAAAYITGLHLKPVFLISNPARLVGGVEPWSPASRGQWQQLSKDQQKEYGRQQAASIMNMPPEQRDQVIREMKQMDRFFDSVKDPLEKLIGHDL